MFLDWCHSKYCPHQLFAFSLNGTNITSRGFRGATSWHHWGFLSEPNHLGGDPSSRKRIPSSFILCFRRYATTSQARRGQSGTCFRSCSSRRRSVQWRTTSMPSPGSLKLYPWALDETIDAIIPIPQGAERPGEHCCGQTDAKGGTKNWFYCVSPESNKSCWTGSEYWETFAGWGG